MCPVLASYQQRDRLQQCTNEAQTVNVAIPCKTFLNRDSFANGRRRGRWGRNKSRTQNYDIVPALLNQTAVHVDILFLSSTYNVIHTTFMFSANFASCILKICFDIAFFFQLFFLVDT